MGVVVGKGMLRKLFRWGAPDQSADARQPPSNGHDTIIYAVADLHGEAELLLRMRQAIARDVAAHAATRRPHVVFLGDYVDRGRASREVIDILLEPPAAGFRHSWLRGNHDQLMLDFLDDPVAHAWWLEVGGALTLASYGVRASVGAADPARLRAIRDQLSERVPPAHLAFLRALEPFIVAGDYALVHAGIRPGRRLDEQATEDLLTMREPFLSHPGPHQHVIVHGHTVVPRPERHPWRIAVDTGAYATGVLTAAVLSGTELRFLSVDASGARP